MNLLVSVRSVAEAIAALQGGADLIDIKEPDRGTLGKADDTLVAAIVEVIAGRRPVSAAMGELRETVAWTLPSHRLEFVKFGLAGCIDQPWRERLLELRALAGEVTVVPSAYADWQRAGAPSVDAVARFVIEQRFPVMLIDTWKKDGRNLFSWLDRIALRTLVDKLGANACRVALAGSLSIQDLESIREVRPAWMAVRGAVCVEQDRKSRIEVERVRCLKSALSVNPGTNRHSTSDTRDRS